MRATVTPTSSLKPFPVKELTYKRVGYSGNACLIDCFKDNVLLMTYKGFYNHRTGDYTLYPSVNHRFDPRTPDKHIVHVTQLK